MSLLNKLTKFAKQNPDKIKQFADKAQNFAKDNPDKVRKFADTANQKTGGKYRDKIDQVVRKVGAQGPNSAGPNSAGPNAHQPYTPPAPGSDLPPYQPPR